MTGSGLCRQELSLFNKACQSCIERMRHDRDLRTIELPEEKGRLIEFDARQLIAGLVDKQSQMGVESCPDIMERHAELFRTSRLSAKALGESESR